MISGFFFKRNLSTQISNHVKEFVEARINANCYDKLYTSKWKLIDARENEGYCLAELKVQQEYVNVGKNVHGGVLASLIDIITTCAVYNTQMRKPGVSVDLKISYLKPAKLNETMLIEGKIKKLGSKLAFLDGNIYLKASENSYELKNNLLVASGLHIKYIL